MAVRMELSRILIRELNDIQLIELREVLPDQEEAESANGPAEELPELSEPSEPEGRSFPIVIGLPEAEAIKRRLTGVTVKRPQTHDLLANVISELGGTLESISINDLSEHTFYATLNVRKEDGTEVNIDSRPSDAIALGIAGSVPIYVEEHVLDAATSEEL